MHVEVYIITFIIKMLKFKISLTIFHTLLLISKNTFYSWLQSNIKILQDLGLMPVIDNFN